MPSSTFYGRNQLKKTLYIFLAIFQLDYNMPCGFSRFKNPLICGLFLDHCCGVFLSDFLLWSDIGCWDTTNGDAKHSDRDNGAGGECCCQARKEIFSMRPWKLNFFGGDPGSWSFLVESLEIEIFLENCMEAGIFLVERRTWTFVLSAGEPGSQRRGILIINFQEEEAWKLKDNPPSSLHTPLPPSPCT